MSVDLLVSIAITLMSFVRLVNMFKIKLPGVVTRVLKGQVTFYYRYRLNGLRKYIKLGDTLYNNKTQIRERHAQAVNKVFNLKHGLEPVNTQVQEEKPVSVLLRDVFDTWVRHEQNRSRTWLRDLHNMKHFVLYFGSESDWIVKDKRVSSSCTIDLAKLTSTDINAFYADQYKLHSNETVTKRNNYLNPLYTWLENEGILKDNYYKRKAKLKSASETRIPYQVLSREQAESIVDNAPDQYCKILWSIMLDTALSPVDARKLSRKKDLQYGGENKLPCIVTNRAKTGKVSAIVISDALLQLGDDLWQLDTGESRKKQNSANQQFLAVCSKLGIEQNPGENLSQYSFRHSLATHLINQGWSLDQVQRALGHTLGSKVTERYIANQVASELEQQKTVTKRTA